MEERIIVPIENLFSMAVDQVMRRAADKYRKEGERGIDKWDYDITLNDIFNIMGSIQSQYDDPTNTPYVYNIFDYPELEKYCASGLISMIHDERGTVYHVEDKFVEELRWFYEDLDGSEIEELDDFRAGTDEILGVFPIEESKEFRDGFNMSAQHFIVFGSDDNPPFVQ